MFSRIKNIDPGGPFFSDGRDLYYLISRGMVKGIGKVIVYYLFYLGGI